MRFYDLKRRKFFTTNNYKVVTRVVKGKKMKFATTKAPSGMKIYKAVK
jgi:hypothetical protein